MRTRSTHTSTHVCSLLTSALALLGLAACSNGQIDWVNVVRFGGITSVATPALVGRLPIDADRGPVFATVPFRLDGTMHAPPYQPPDGDAASLDAGTPIDTVQGYAPPLRLLARFAGRLTCYEADTTPHATIGADLLAVGGMVHAMGVTSEQDGTTELAVVQDRA
jgi:hypothetical protein